MKFAKEEKSVFSIIFLFKNIRYFIYDYFLPLF